LNLVKYPIEFYANLIEKNYDFSIMRWGDGEMGHLLGYMSGTDANGHQYFPQLQKDLEMTLIERLTRKNKFNYCLAMQPMGYKLFQRDWDFLLKEYEHPAEEWHDSTTLLEAIVNTNLHGFIKAINTRNVIMVAPSFLDKPFLPFKVATWVDVPERDCYLEMARIASDIITEASFVNNPLVLLSCGMAAKPILHRIFETISKQMEGSIWDLGSMWDPFAGRATRSPYHKLPSNYAENYK
jgi:hypothetical protein